MKSHTRYLTLRLPRRLDFRNITPQVEEAVRESGVREGLCQIMGREVVVAITEGRPDFGPWEQIFYGEFDGRREKRVLIKVLGA